MVSRQRLPKPIVFTSIPPASRSSWSGQLVVGSVTVPVKAYSATIATSNSAIHMVHRDCGQSIAQPRTCPEHGPVATDEIAKVFQYAPGDNVVISTAEFESLRPQANDQLRIEHLLTASKFDLSLLSGRTLFLIPSHSAASSEYGLVCSLLARSDLWGVGRVVLNDRIQLVALRVVQDNLTAFVLHWPQVRRGCPAFDQSPADSSRLRQLAKDTIALRKGFNWDSYQDDYEKRLNELVRAKIQTRTACQRATATKPSKNSNLDQTSKAA